MMQMCDVVLPLAISEIERDWGRPDDIFHEAFRVI